VNGSHEGGARLLRLDAKGVAALGIEQSERRRVVEDELGLGAEGTDAPDRRRTRADEDVVDVKGEAALARHAGAGAVGVADREDHRVTYLRTRIDRDPREQQSRTGGAADAKPAHDSHFPS
jgi:hypothetical protein